MFLPHCFMSIVKMAAMNKVSRIFAQFEQLQADSGLNGRGIGCTCGCADQNV